ncbi:MAG: hypothetical protein QOJ92_2043 [Frankiales bacterium]|nr:hypothetical protein [Frankiales bacterium]
MVLEAKNIEKPDDRRDFAKGHIDVVNLPGLAFGQATFEPGWRWSESVKPIAGTDTCMVAHNGYIVAGRLAIRMSDGSQVELEPGDAFVCSPGHDAWVVGDEPCIALDFAGGAAEYAKA